MFCLFCYLHVFAKLLIDWGLVRKLLDVFSKFSQYNYCVCGFESPNCNILVLFVFRLRLYFCEIICIIYDSLAVRCLLVSF